MGGIIDKITDFIKEMLQGWVLSNLETMFTDVNDKVGTIAGEVSKTPSSWNSGIFSMVQTLSENVIVPIAGMIISFVLVYELITMVIDKNNIISKYLNKGKLCCFYTYALSCATKVNIEQQLRGHAV